jgi:hypothetical protein
LALPAISALYLAHRNRAQRVAAAAHLIGQPHTFACPGSIDNIYLYGGHSGLEFCMGVSQSIEHMFEYKTGVGHLKNSLQSLGAAISAIYQRLMTISLRNSYLYSIQISNRMGRALFEWFYFEIIFSTAFQF